MCTITEIGNMARPSNCITVEPCPGGAGLVDVRPGGGRLVGRTVWLEGLPLCLAPASQQELVQMAGWGSYKVLLHLQVKSRCKKDNT